MLLSAVSVLIVAQSSSEIPEGLMNNPVYPSTNKAMNYGAIKTCWTSRGTGVVEFRPFEIT